MRCLPQFHSTDGITGVSGVDISVIVVVLTRDARWRVGGGFHRLYGCLPWFLGYRLRLVVVVVVVSVA